MNVATSTYRAALVAAALACAGIPAIANADSGRDEARSRYAPDRGRYGGWQHDRRYRAEPPRAWARPGYRYGGYAPRHWSPPRHGHGDGEVTIVIRIPF